MTWFRVYTSLVHDPKIQSLAPDDFRTLVNCWCVAKDKNGVLPGLDDLAFILRCPVRRLSLTLDRLQGRGLIDKDEEGRCRPHDWDFWQRANDVSTERVRRYRKRCETVSGNEAEPFQETTPEQRRTETEQKQNRTDVSSSPTNGSNGHSELTPQELSDDLSEIAKAMFARHRRGRKASIKGTLDALFMAVFDQLDPVAAAHAFDERHKGWCESEDWQKRDGQFVPWLEEWIKGPKGLAEPPDSREGKQPWE